MIFVLLQDGEDPGRRVMPGLAGADSRVADIDAVPYT
jgi:hypothetical protein